MALDLVFPNCYFASVDLKDAYYSVPIHGDYKKFLRFTWREVLYEFNCMPMGLACAPRLFTKLMKPVYSFLRSNGFDSVAYIDDSLLIGSSPSECTLNVEATMKLLRSLGFYINVEKSSFLPSTEIKF